MINCNKCGYVGAYYGPKCPACKEKFNLTPAEIEEKVREIGKAEQQRQYELVAECHHILADLGRTESQIKYADMLERGDSVVRDLDGAMAYYYMAAEKNNATAAYKYSRLAERTSDKASSFWLAYAAALGCVEAYPKIADKYAQFGDDDLANYYYAMAAAYDDTDSIVTLAKRYYNGTGTEQNLPYAKWYMDKLLLPPIHAIKMAYKLRSVKSQDPGIPRHPDYHKMLRRLAIKAQDYGFAKQYHHLCEMLSEEGDVSARVILGLLYAEGRGCRQDAGTALSLLSSAAAEGSKDAYRHMGDIYIAGLIVERDAERALECYRAAAKLGMTNAYETMGDIFRDGEIVNRDIGRAIELYDMGAKEGHSSAAEKAETLRSQREGLYKTGIELRTSAPEQSFRAFAISASMGYVPAYKEMARAFLEGRGIKKNRQQAYLWFEKSAESGDEDALYEYGLCYSRGIGTAFDFDKAVEVLSKAARLGSGEARSEIERIMNNKRRHMLRSAYSDAMSLIYQKKFKEAESMLRICLRLGHAKGIYTLGCLNEFGLGIPTNRDVAFRLYETAFELKFRDPRSVYKLKILRMVRAYK
ncbi:MAG: sel1 repeat family protein [Clostridia bacterium]|nr:sel1 repeat family protein [Clostridia bacterium]